MVHGSAVDMHKQVLCGLVLTVSQKCPYENPCLHEESDPGSTATKRCWPQRRFGLDLRRSLFSGLCQDTLLSGEHPDGDEGPWPGPTAKPLRQTPTVTLPLMRRECCIGC